MENKVYFEDIKDINDVDVKQYVSFTVKKLIVENIIENSTKTGGGLIKIDYAFLELIKTLTIITQYTNIDVGDDPVYTYDILKEKGLIDEILMKINKSEILFINRVIENEIEQINKIDNSIQSVVLTALEKLVDKIPDEKGLQKVIREIPKALNKISPEVLATIKDIKQ